MKYDLLKHVGLIVGAMIVFQSCWNSSPDIPVETALSSIELQCRPLPMADSTELPTYQINLVLDRIQELPLDTLPICERITSEQYASLDMPQAVIQAVGGFWAGNGHYYYLLRESKKAYLLAYGWQDDTGAVARIQYQPVRRIALQ